MDTCIDRLTACGYDRYEAAVICQMLLKEGGDSNLLRYVQEAEYAVATVQQ